MRRAAVLLPALLFLAACAGIEARERALMPAMSKQWSTTIAGAVEAGVAAGEAASTLTPAQAAELRAASTAMQEGLDSGDRFNVAVVNWAALRQTALVGIQARVDASEIAAGVGLSLVETVNKFDQAYTVVTLR